MVYAGITAAGFRNQPGTLSEKIAVQSAAVKAETDAHALLFAAGLKVAKVSIAGGAQNTISFAWQNPEASKILVTKAILRILTPGLTGSAVMDIGVVADATSTADTIIDGVAVTVGGLFDNITNKGSNGLPQIIVDENSGTNDFITGKILTAAAGELTGKIYIVYTVV